MTESIFERLVSWGLSIEAALLATDAIKVVLVSLVAVISYKITKSILLRIIRKVASRTDSDWDDKLVEERVFDRLAHLVPALAIHLLAPIAFSSPALIDWTRRAAELYALAGALSAGFCFLNVGTEIYGTFPIARRFPIRIYVQVAKILLAAGALIVTIAVLTGQSPLLLLSGLGAMTAILLLISKDSIQGLLAGIQLVATDMVRTGDWIEMPRFGADGDVIAITLHTVKVQNWDKTITMIPTFKLISESFKNWRGMEDSAGRRIKRSIHLDVSSVEFCDAAMIERFRKIKLLTDYIDGKQAEIAGHNRERGAEESPTVNGRNLTNVGIFRQYLVNYLRAHPMVNNDLTLIVRQLQPTQNGLPLEVYAFSSDKAWANYEGIQSDIFDHILAILPEFGLRAFQTPTGQDLVRGLRPS